MPVAPPRKQHSKNDEFGPFRLRGLLRILIEKDNKESANWHAPAQSEENYSGCFPPTLRFGRDKREKTGDHQGAKYPQGDDRSLDDLRRPRC
jgi:hypothetical protein